MKWFTTYRSKLVTPFTAFCDCYILIASVLKNFMFVNEDIRDYDITGICALMTSP